MAHGHWIMMVQIETIETKRNNSISTSAPILIAKVPAMKQTWSPENNNITTTAREKTDESIGIVTAVLISIDSSNDICSAVTSYW